MTPAHRHPILGVMTPDVKRYMGWRTILKRYPHGLMMKAEAARVLGTSQRVIDNWCQSGIARLQEVTIPGYDEPYVPTDQVLDLVEDIELHGKIDLKIKSLARRRFDRIARTRSYNVRYV